MIREGFASYYVVKKNSEYEYEETVMKNNKCDALLPFDIRRVDDESYYYFKISGYISLKEKMGQKSNSVVEFQEIYEKIFQAVEEVEEYLLPSENILLESETTFYEEGKKKIYFCYVPGMERNLMQQLLDLTEEFLEVINYEDKELVELLYQVHESISKGKLPIFHELMQKKENVKQVKIEEEKEEMPFPEREEEEEEEVLFMGNASVKQSTKWYVEMLVCVLLGVALLLLLGFELYQLYRNGWRTQTGKYVLVLVAGFVLNVLYTMRKARQKSRPETFTTILTEEERIGKIGE